MRQIIILILLSLSLFSASFKQPLSNFIASGAVIDLVYKDSKIYATTDAGTVDIFDYKSKKLIKKIKVDMIQDFMGDLVDSKVFSVDEIDDEIMILSQSKKGFSRVHVDLNGKSKLLIDYTKKLSIIKAKYLNKNTLLLALLSNEIISYDIKQSKLNYRVQVSGAKFSDFSLNEDKTKVAVADESGDVQIHDTLSGKNIKSLKGQNLDNVFQIDFKNSVIATAGQDRRVAIYFLNSDTAYYKKSDFLIYSVGLSPSGNIVGFASDENNNVSLFNSNTKLNLGKFGGNSITLSNIVFVDENNFLVASNSKIINLYSVK